ncbi:TetR/AcrR family transcriptional regulator [Crocosphaera sp. Alani8]|uniref:TetR/AcrR family transcriptional regulator n=1 Tax=Crocosphaera sp. Alani8 TaxID=3038952 RepID=UPI00313CE75C
MATSPNTSEHILNIAEQLFAENGYAGTSLRSIIKEAGVNLSAVSYHFGSKEDLYMAIVKRVAEPVVREEKEMLAKCRQENGCSSVEKILEAFLKPGFKVVLSNGDRSFQCARFMGRCLTEPDFIKAKIEKQFEPGVQACLDELQKALPDKSRNNLQWKLDLVIAALLKTFVEAKKPGALIQDNSPESINLVVSKMVVFFAPGMQF